MKERIPETLISSTSQAAQWPVPHVLHCAISQMPHPTLGKEGTEGEAFHANQ